MKLHRYAALTLILTMPTFAVQDVASAVEGTVKKIDSGTETILVTTKDGTEHTYHYVERTTIHGGEAAGKGSKDVLHGLKTGTEVAVHFTTRGTLDTADEIDRIGADGLKATEGTLKQIDRGAKTISIVTADGAEHTFRLLGRTARDTGRDLDKGADKSAKVTVYYAEEGGDKVAHFFKSAF
jgi:hypothetical protein